MMRLDVYGVGLQCVVFVAPTVHKKTVARDIYFMFCAELRKHLYTMHTTKQSVII